MIDVPLPPPWMADGSCLSAGDPDAWFPEGAGTPAPAIVFRICADCPVRDLCLDYAVARPELDGVWGGTTSRERSALRVKTGMTSDRSHHAPQPCGTIAAARRHWRKREPLCDPCREANARAVADRYQRRKAEGRLPERDRAAENRARKARRAGARKQAS